jgi:hypothetical protein
MKRMHVLIYLLAFTCLLHISCEKQANSTASPSAGGAGGSLARFAVVGNYLYVVDTYTLTVFDITDPANPSHKNAVQAGFDIETIFPYKDKLFLGGSNGMYIYSIANPTSPVKESMVTHFRACDPVISNDSVSYVTLRTGTTGNCVGTRNVLNIYNVRDPKDPKLVKEVAMKSPHGLGMKQQGLYICEGANGLVVFDLANPYQPTKVKEFTNEKYYDVIPYGDVLIAYIEQGVCFFDISNPLDPLMLGKVKG